MNTLMLFAHNLSFLANNEIRSIPSEIGLMANLTSLVLGKNLLLSASFVIVRKYLDVRK